VNDYLSNKDVGSLDALLENARKREAIKTINQQDYYKQLLAAIISLCSRVNKANVLGELNSLFRLGYLEEVLLIQRLVDSDLIFIPWLQACIESGELDSILLAQSHGNLFLNLTDVTSASDKKVNEKVRNLCDTIKNHDMEMFSLGIVITLSKKNYCEKKDNNVYCMSIDYFLNHFLKNS